MKKLRLLFVLIASVAWMSGCSGDSGPNAEPEVPPTPVAPTTVAVTGVSVSKANLIIKEGESEEINVTITPENASNKDVTWKSEDTSVATVSNGKITAVAPGSTIITVTTADGNKTAPVNVIVSINMIGRQKKALLALYNATEGESWTHNEGWNTEAELKDWYGVTMGGDHDEQVISILLAKNNLKGNIPDEFFETMTITRLFDEAKTRAEVTEAILNGLVELDLSDNELTGEIPTAIGNLTALETLKLNNNKLTGNLPETITNLTKLSTLTIAHNELDGEIPKTITESSVWKNIENGIDLTQDNGKTLDDVQPVPIIPEDSEPVTEPDSDLNPEADNNPDSGSDSDNSNDPVSVDYDYHVAVDPAIDGNLPDPKPDNDPIPDTGTDAGSDSELITGEDENGSDPDPTSGNNEPDPIPGNDNPAPETDPGEQEPVIPTPTIVSVTGVTLNKLSLELTVGGSETLTAKLSPEDASDKAVSWKSSDTSIATVDNGKVTAIKEGKATITVTTRDGEKTATCEVNVKAASGDDGNPTASVEDFGNIH